MRQKMNVKFLRPQSDFDKEVRLSRNNNFVFISYAKKSLGEDIKCKFSSTLEILKSYGNVISWFDSKCDYFTFESANNLLDEAYCMNAGYEPYQFEEFTVKENGSLSSELDSELYPICSLALNTQDGSDLVVNLYLYDIIAICSEDKQVVYRID